MGQLDPFAKQIFEEETATLTGGAVAWQTPPEIGLTEVRLDGLLVVRRPEQLGALPAPWPLAAANDEIVVELKMPGDHLDAPMLERALLRRQARQVQRMEDPAVVWRGQTPLWVVAPHLPRWVGEQRTVRRLAPGCYRLDRSPFVVLWVAANELPLADELTPFLVARSGRALDAFARWSAARRPVAWVLRMVQFLPMSTSVSDDLVRVVSQSEDPEVFARQRRMARFFINADPKLRAEIIEQGIEQGIEKGMVQLFERRLARPLASGEAVALHERLGRLGSGRLGDVLFEYSAEALAAWLADPDAS